MRKLKIIFIRLFIKMVGNIQIFPGPLFLLLWGSTSYKIKGLEQRHILGLLKKGDILLRRYDRYLSGLVIPGFYTHAALYSGDGRIVHAVTKGVCEEDILTFLRADYVAVLRHPGLRKYRTDGIIDRARNQIGKGYDFLFETGDDDRFYCTELIKYAYEILDIPSRKTITPDRLLKADLSLVFDSRVWRAEQTRNAEEETK